ncbi:hypothetical protein K501DRAFT_336339 [Backusella circina FSU 941]|nr:hypothetical protein K501DRAFT_336339 [Backusella circina FSU 941]
MRAIKRKWCLDYFKLSILLICLFHFGNALNNADFGLERYDHCAFSYNEALYILGGESTTTTTTMDEVIITFNQTNWNTEAPIIQRLQSNVTGKVKCGVTKNAVLLLFDNYHTVQVLNISSTNNSMTYQGSQKAIDSFVTNKTPIKNPAITAFGDYFLIYGGEQDDHTLLQSTFILDTRISNVGVWYELSPPSNNSSSSFIGNPPPPSANTTLVATSRWILHFRVLKINPVTYTVYVDLFDPLNFNWLGTPITAFNTSTDAIHAIPLSPDTLLVTPTWNTFDSSSSNDSMTGFWILNVSTWTPTATAEWQEISENYYTVSGSSVTAIQNTDLVVFYGGINGSLQFFNSTSKAFEHPTWYSQETENGHHLLAILLGSILGGLLFFILLFLFVWFCCIRKKRLRKQEFMSRSYDESHAKEHMMPNESTSQFRRSNSVASRYLLSPIKSVLPLFKDNEMESVEQVEQDQAVATSKIHPTSRFREHFDMSSLPDLKKSNHLDQGPSSSNQ